jgi:hypothetical protein
MSKVTLELGNTNASLNNVVKEYGLKAMQEIQAYIETNLRSESKVKNRIPRNTKFGEGSLRFWNTKDGLLPSLEIGGKNNIFKQNGLRTQYGTDLIYSAIHEFGGNAGRGGSAKIPARPYFFAGLKEWESEREKEFMIDFAFAVARVLNIKLTK